MRVAPEFTVTVPVTIYGLAAKVQEVSVEIVPLTLVASANGAIAIALMHRIAIKNAATKFPGARSCLERNRGSQNADLLAAFCVELKELGVVPVRPSQWTVQ